MHSSSCAELDIFNAYAEQPREHLGNSPPPPPNLQNASGNIVLLRSLNTLQTLNCVSHFGTLVGLFHKLKSVDVFLKIIAAFVLSRPFGKVRSLLYVSRSSVVSSCSASNLLVSSSQNSIAFSESATSFGFFCRLVSLASSSFVLKVNVPRTMWWSSPVLNLLITDTSVRT